VPLHPRQLQHPLLRQLRLLLHHQLLLRQLRLLLHHQSLLRQLQALQAEQLLRCLLSVRA
jgi:hypothetical protein